MANPNESALLARVRGGDLSAFEDLTRPYEGRVYQAVLRITRNESDAADVYQTAMMAAFEKLDGFRGDAAFGTWLYQIAVNAALMHQRAARHNPVVAEEDLPEFNWMGGYAQPVHDWTDSAEDQLSRSELRRALADALESLPDLERAIVWSKDVAGMSHSQIATATDSTVLAVRTRLHRARLRLRERLARHSGGA
ncbi:MAG: sigma-70 family RNA polymerase sigma factor [Deltaproteobacteria bacterium]|nr:sigma-70 family RNA polymerase sigma factor [Deltaproteobacteria bacterium]